MREIKFRGYAVEEMVNSQWLYGFGVYAVEFTEEYAKEIGRKREWWLYTGNGEYRVYEKSIAQFTGLKDKNDIEIYENDLVDVWRLGTKKRFEVKWREEGVPMYILYPQPIEECGMWNLRSDMQMAIEVVGNTYEGKE